MKRKIFYCVFVTVFSIIFAHAQTNSTTKARILVDSLIRFGELEDTTLGMALFFYDFDTSRANLEFINITSQDQMRQIDSVCESVNKDSLHCYVFFLWKDHSICHFAFLYNDALSVINLNRPLDAIINDIYLYIRKLNLDAETVKYIFTSAIYYHYTNSWAAERRQYDPLNTPCRFR